ncbi:RNA polymerase subunit sigma-54 [Aerococcaceae bacterium NML191219]|nr:RNA polymerase subunit sigma-54 [Aerococcaceae bacterium NML191219]
MEVIDKVQIRMNGLELAGEPGEWLQDKRLLSLLELNAECLTEFLETEILDNPFIELDYADAKMTSTVRAQETVLGVDPQMPEMPQTLPAFLFEQIMMFRQTPIRDAMVRLIDYLDERGYIPHTYQELAAKLGLPEIIVLDALTLVKQLEPSGVGAFDLRECLMLQTEQDSYAPNVAYYLLEEFFAELSDKKFDTIVAKTDLTMAEIQDCVQYYHTLRTMPAAMFERRTQLSSFVPDVAVAIHEGRLAVSYNHQYSPKIVFNQSYFAEMEATQDPEVLAYIAPQKEGYHALSTLLSQREYLILKVAQAIVTAQYDLFTHATEIKAPLLLKQIAQVTDLPEPIVNLIVTNKYLEFEKMVNSFADFITVATHEGRGGFTAENVKQMVQEVISQGGSTLSNAEIIRQLAERKVIITERMVEHYRQNIGQ